MRFRRFGYRNSKHREEAAKLLSGLINAFSAASVIGAIIGPALNPALAVSLERSLILLAGGVIFHLIAQMVLFSGYPRPGQ